MYFDVTSFGYGVGLVLVGWAAGMVFGIVIKSLKAIGFISFFAVFIIMPSVSEAVPYDCGKLSTMVVSHNNKNGDHAIINGVVTVGTGAFYQSFQCSGLVDVTCENGLDYTVSLLPFSNPYQVTDFSMIVSFLIGAMTGLAFVMSSSSLHGGSL